MAAIPVVVAFTAAAPERIGRDTIGLYHEREREGNKLQPPTRSSGSRIEDKLDDEKEEGGEE